MNINKELQWGWYFSDNNETYNYGPYETKQQAIDEANGYYSEGTTVFIIEAYKKPLNLFDYIDLYNVLENANYEVCQEHGDPEEYTDIFDFDTTQFNDLNQRIKQTCDDWQKDNNLVFMPYMFKEIRNEDQIVVKY